VKGFVFLLHCKEPPREALSFSGPQRR